MVSVPSKSSTIEGGGNGATAEASISPPRSLHLVSTSRSAMAFMSNRKGGLHRSTAREHIVNFMTPVQIRANRRIRTYCLRGLSRVCRESRESVANLSQIHTRFRCKSILRTHANSSQMFANRTVKPATLIGPANLVRRPLTRHCKVLVAHQKARIVRYSAHAKSFSPLSLVMEASLLGRGGADMRMGGVRVQTGVGEWRQAASPARVCVEGDLAHSRPMPAAVPTPSIPSYGESPLCAACMPPLLPLALPVPYSPPAALLACSFAPARCFCDAGALNGTRPAEDGNSSSANGLPL